MTSIEEELRMDEENDAREAEYILHTLSSELQDRYTTDDIRTMMDLIVEYYYDSGMLECTDAEVEIDLQDVADYVAKHAKEYHEKDYPVEDVFFVVQADFDWQEQNL